MLHCLLFQLPSCNLGHGTSAPRRTHPLSSLNSLLYLLFLLQSQWKTQQHLTCTETTVHHGDQHRSTVSWKFMTASTCFLLLYVQIISALKDRWLLLAYWSITNTSHNPMATHTPFQILFWMASLCLTKVMLFHLSVCCINGMLTLPISTSATRSRMPCHQ